MSELYEKSLQKLELDRVLEMLAERAGSEMGKEVCRRLKPTSDLEEVQERLDQKMTTAFHAVHNMAEERGVETRMAAYLVAVNRVAEAVRARGWV